MFRPCHWAIVRSRLASWRKLTTKHFFLPYIGQRTPQETIPLSVPFFLFFPLFSFSPLSGFRYLEFFDFLSFDFDICFLTLFSWFFVFCFSFCVFCVIWILFFHLINYFTTTFIRNSPNSLVLLNLFIYDLLYFTFVFSYIICICICYFA